MKTLKEADLFNRHGKIETVVGSLRCEPPITWKEWRHETEHGTDFDAEPDDDEPNWYVTGYLRIHQTEAEIDTDEGVLRKRSFDIIKAYRPICSGEDLWQSLDDFVRRFATTPDGTPRRFEGMLHAAETADDLGDTNPRFWKINVGAESGAPSLQRRTATLHWPSHNIDKTEP